MSDGTHLTKAGTNRLAKCLKLEIRANAKKDITKSPPKKTYAESLRQRQFGATPSATQASKQAARHMPGVQGPQNHAPANATQRSGNTAPPTGRLHHELTTPSGGRPHSHSPQQRTDQRRNESYRHTSENCSYGYGPIDSYVNHDTRSLPRCYNCNERITWWTLADTRQRLLVLNVMVSATKKNIVFRTQATKTVPN